MDAGRDADQARFFEFLPKQVSSGAAIRRGPRDQCVSHPAFLGGLRTPTEKNSTRVVLSEEEYRALLKVSRRVDWRFHVALVLSHETGHRIGSIRQLRWPDIDFEGGSILWRAEHDKSGFNTSLPLPWRPTTR